MSESERKRLADLNAALWFLAIVIPPLMRAIPTSSGEPPKIYSLLIPIFLMIFGAISTSLVLRSNGK